MRQLYTFLLLLGIFTLSSCQEKSTEKTSTLPTVSEVNKEEVTPEVKEVESPPFYICYNSGSNPDLALSIYFDGKGVAQKARYKGQSASLDLKFEKEEYLEGGAHPTINEYYTEIYEGKPNGTYKLSHSGIWDYAVYTRKKDGKVFEFTIDHELAIVNDTYRETACY